MDRINTCKVGDTVIHKRKAVYVSDVMIQGREDNTEKKGWRAYICVCPIMPDNGQVLKRSPSCIEENWKHNDLGR